MGILWAHTGALGHIAATSLWSLVLVPTPAQIYLFEAATPDYSGLKMLAPK